MSIAFPLDSKRNYGEDGIGALMIVRLDVLHLSAIMQYMNVLRRAEKKRRTKTAVLTIRLDPRIKAAAEIAAEKEHRSVTAFIEVLILNHCRAAEIELPIVESGKTSE